MSTNPESDHTESPTDALLDSLLLAAFHDRPESLRSRVAAAMERINSNPSDSGPTTVFQPSADNLGAGAAAPAAAAGANAPQPAASHLPQPVPARPRRDRLWSRPVSLALAASLLVLVWFGFQTLQPSRTAMAALQQSLAVAREAVPRHYLLTVTFRADDGELAEAVNDLYVAGNDRVALRHPGILPGTSLWIGKSGDEGWVVPAVGPVLKGDGQALLRWVTSRREVPAPYLHITALLDRMSRGYRLTEGPELSVLDKSGKPAWCRQITGRLRGRNQAALPQTIVLWADASSGMVVRLEASWPPGSHPAGRERVTLEFVGQPVLPEDWFSASGHYSGNRRISRLESIR